MILQKGKSDSTSPMAAPGTTVKNSRIKSNQLDDLSITYLNII